MDPVEHNVRTHPEGGKSNGLIHSQEHGFDEGRRGTLDFDVDRHLANYEDLRSTFYDGNGSYDEDAAPLHYISHGYFEGRTDDLIFV